MQESYEALAEKIVATGRITREELDARVREKIDRLSGLISKEGAAYIIANEFGVMLFTPASTRLQIGKILQGMRNVETAGKVIRVFEKRQFQSGERTGKLASFIFGDETGSIRAVLWGELAEKISEIRESDIVHLSGGYVKVSNIGQKELHLNERSKITLNPEGLSIQLPDRPAAERKWLSDIKESDNAVEAVGSIVQIFDPRFFEVCPKCGKRARVIENEVRCDADGVVTPAYGCVVNAMLDDGTDNMRVVMFRKQAAQLLKKDEAGLLEYRESPELFIQTKNELIGSIIKVRGRPKKNALFDRIEITADFVDPSPNPEEELKILTDIEAKMNTKA
jgi:ssDNA-binding replication factor A large subunit